MRLIKKMGKFFIHSKLQEIGILHFKVILVDNGYSHFQHLISCINNLRKSLSNIDIVILTLPSRAEFINNLDKGLKIIVAKRKYIPKRFRIAFELFLLSRKKFDFVTLLTSDIMPVLVSLLFVRKRLYIYHPQHKWSLLRRKTLNEHLLIIPRFIFNLFVFIYLLFAAIFIFLKRTLAI